MQKRLLPFRSLGQRLALYLLPSTKVSPKDCVNSTIRQFLILPSCCYFIRLICFVICFPVKYAQILVFNERNVNDLSMKTLSGIGWRGTDSRRSVDRSVRKIYVCTSIRQNQGFTWQVCSSNTNISILPSFLFFIKFNISVSLKLI